MIGRRTAAAALLLGLSAAPALADAEGEALVQRFVAWVDSSPEWSASVSVVRSESSDTLAEGLVFSRDEPRISVSIEALRLSDLAERNGGGFSASAIELSKAAVVGEGVEAAVPSASLSDLAMPSLGAVVLDPKHLMTSMARFYTLAAEGELQGLQVPEITVTQQRPTVAGASTPVEVTSQYRNLSIEDFSDGVLRHQSFGPISVRSASDEPGKTVDLTIDKIEAERVDIGAFAHILDSDAYRDGRGDAIWRPLFSRASYRGFTGTGGDATFRLNDVSVENVDGRQPEEPFTAIWDRLLDPDTAQEAKNDLALEAVTAMLSAWRIGTIHLDGMSMQAPSEAIDFSLKSASLTGWSADGIDSFLLDALRLSAREGFLALHSLELAGFVSPDIKAIMKFAAIEKGIDPEKHAAAIREAFAALPRLRHFGMEGLAFGKSEAESLSVAGVALDFDAWNALYAGATDFRLSELKIPRQLMELDPQATEMFDTLGYDELVLDMSLSDRWEPDLGSDEATWRFGLRDMMDMELSYSLTGLTLDWLMRATAAAGASDNGGAALMAMLDDLGVRHAKLSVTDRSLLDRGFAFAAKKQGLNVEGAAYREQMRAALPFIISAAVPADLAKLVTEPVQAFLEGRKTLVAEAEPVAPLPIQELIAAAANPMGLPDLLQLKLRSEAAPR